MADEALIRVSVVYSDAARNLHEVNLSLERDSTVWQALLASNFLQRFPELEQAGTVLGVWGRKSGSRQTLRENDRVEIYRPLRVDPKVARRERFAKQGARSAGLFLKQRGDAKVTD